MIKSWLRGLFLLLLSQISLAQIAVMDGTGRQVQLAAPAQRVVSLAPHITENLFAIGAGSQLVGATEYSDYPPQAVQLPRVGSYERPNLEAILALKPDLVIAWQQGSYGRALARLEALGVPVYRTDPTTFKALAYDLTRYGQLLGHTQQAARKVAELEERLQHIRSRYQRRSPVKAFYQLWPQPLMTANNQILLGRMMQLCGADNIFGARPESVPRISIEAVVAAAPEVIITSNEVPAEIQQWQDWPQIPAVANQQLCVLPADNLHRMTLRALDGLQAMCTCIDQARQLQELTP